LLYDEIDPAGLRQTKDQSRETKAVQLIRLRGLSPMDHAGRQSRSYGYASCGRAMRWDSQQAFDVRKIVGAARGWSVVPEPHGACTALDQPTPTSAPRRKRAKAYRIIR
jgi:hypothetical protein